MQYINSRLRRHAQLLEYEDKQADLDTLTPYLIQALSHDTFDINRVDKDALITYMQNGIHWAKHRKSSQGSFRDAFEIHLEHLLNLIPATKEWVDALNVPDKWDNRTLLMESVLQTGTGYRLLRILLVKFHVDLSHIGSIMTRKHISTDSFENACLIVCWKFVEERKADYDLMRFLYFFSAIVEHYPEVTFEKRQEMMHVKNRHNRDAIYYLHQHKTFLQTHEKTGEIQQVLIPWCTNEEWKMLFE